MSALIRDINQLDPNKTYTYTDYLSWQFDEFVELIRGKLVRISPAPSSKHQKCSGNLFGLIWTHLKGKSCHVFNAPYDVRLLLDGVETIVQPDISIICDPEKIRDQACIGAPDWIIEILSPSTAQKDLTDKYQIYEQAGVREYWVVHPNDATILVFRLDAAGKYQALRPTPFAGVEKISSAILSGLVVDLKEVFG